ncbi:hypothetical protein JW964_03300, partial [candidate division KSB1 bacterium]|nr:hypothetical protein [candidate division KSB1 bacterium]
MIDNFIPSLIALTGVFFSVLSSFIISIRQSKIETRKLRNEYLHLYARKIFENRLEAYPLIIEHLVKFFQKVNLFKLKQEEQYEVKIDELRNLFQFLLDWDAQNSTLYSAELQNVIHTTYHNLYNLITTPNEKLLILLKKTSFLKRLRNEL